MAERLLADSSSGPCVMWTRAALLVGGGISFGVYGFSWAMLVVENGRVIAAAMINFGRIAFISGSPDANRLGVRQRISMQGAWRDFHAPSSVSYVIFILHLLQL